MNRTFCLLLIGLFTFSLSYGQRMRKADRALVANLHTHINYLASDRLEGRRSGTKGEQLAGEYISKQFRQVGLQPKGDNNDWYQAFPIYDGKQIDRTTLFLVNGHDMKLEEDFFPLAISPNTSLEAAVAMALAERGVPWFYDLNEILPQNAHNPHFDLEQSLLDKANEIAPKGATALIVYNSSTITDHLAFDGKRRGEKAAIPVIYLTHKAMAAYFNDESAMLDIKIKVSIGDKTRTGHNVIGYINNNAPTTVILGAHYDHLGYGEDGGSRLVNGERLIHNGADDNASGTAALIELARSLKQSRDKKNNYLFIAFSGEELGLFGSKYFTEHPVIDLDKVSYMINMDMVGRLNDSSKAITIGGYGTSPAWGQLLPEVKEKKYLSVKFDSSGTGPSDHTSFYRKNIPVLFFFTGLHADYHKPTDDADKINYTGEWLVIRYIREVIDEANDQGKLAFTPTREQQTSTTARFSVTLGIMPDYTFSGSGVRVDGVSDGRPAHKAGLKAGDIIIRLGDYKISSMEAYMQALSHFKKGDHTRVGYKRGEEEQEAEIQF